MQDASRPLASQLPFEVYTYHSPISQREAARERDGEDTNTKYGDGKSHARLMLPHLIMTKIL